MSDELRQSITAAWKYLNEHGVEIPLELHAQARSAGVFKSANELPPINKAYHDAITNALLGWFEGQGNIAGVRNAFRIATNEAFYDAFYAGYGGNPDADALEWLNARIQLEYGYIETLLQEARELRKETDFDYFTWITQRADGYTNTLREIYNAAKMRGSKDIMVTFDGDDGEESCETCQMLKGQRHRVSWFVKRNYVPPFGTGLVCHPGRRCQHGLVNDDGEWLTV